MNRILKLVADVRMPVESAMAMRAFPARSWRRALGVAVAALCAIAGTTSACAAKETPSLTVYDQARTAEVAKMVQATADAYAANDVGKYFSYFAEDITIYWGGRGRLKKQDYVSGWTRNVAAGGGVSSLKIEDMQIRISPAGDAAVATFTMPVVEREGGKPTITITYLMTEVWFKAGGQWKMLHMDWSVLPEPAK